MGRAWKSTPRRIHIIGAPGSGKSHAAIQLSKRAGIPAYDLNDLFWDRSVKRYGVRAPEIERNAWFAELVKQECWIFEGVYLSWVQAGFDKADVIGVLTPSALLRDWRIIKRFVYRKLGMTPAKSERIIDLCRLIQWNHQYEIANLNPALESMKEHRWKTLVCLSADDLIEHLFDAGGAIWRPSAR
ncbi:DNA topology modulation protein FlaR [Nitrospira sp. KM1]|uniref:hypothetical protein n=1 Tax=Nitrospira sp. KM1 TaxID=1936990 RepID=UPI0013A75966|nr:hypothetical protein [Nitrospira sp. KM1]BCA56286.1 DNA topology modulation protein FlaR [Nitrospira sp. KM1]